MLLDIKNRLLNAYAPTAATTNVDGTYLDIGVAQDLGAAENGMNAWYTNIGTTVTGNTNATLQFVLQAATDSAFTSPVTVDSTTAITQANFATQAVAGTEFKRIIPRGFSYRYWRVAVVIGTATLTAGAFSSWLTPANSLTDNIRYTGGYTF